MIGAFYSATKFADPLIDTLDLPSPYMYTAARFALSESKTINNTVGWFLHSA
jgi:hypothetical protein